MASDVPHSVDELLRWGEELLKKAGIDDYRISAELILRDLLDASRSELLLRHKEKIDSDIFSRYKELVERRAQQTPLQYLLSSVDFHNVRIKCDSRAMIPRPETEILVEKVIGALAPRKAPRILDIGTGSGNIAIALAMNIPDAKTTAVDISQPALDLARENANLNGLQNAIRFIRGDILNQKFIASLGSYDCVVSNPPYIANSERDKLQLEVIEHEPQVALFSGDDPLRFFKAIVKVAPSLLDPAGLLAFEVGLGQAREVAGLMSAHKGSHTTACFHHVSVECDLAEVERIVMGIYGAA